jgi:hypothetical protein
MRWVASGAFALALGFFAAPAFAAPLGTMDGIKAGDATSAVEQVNYRRCWWRYGHRHCRWVGDGYGYGPGIGLYFGGGGRGGHGHGHRR